jgi:hypothetical protein
VQNAIRSVRLHGHRKPPRRLRMRRKKWLSSLTTRK